MGQQGTMVKWNTEPVAAALGQETAPRAESCVHLCHRQASFPPRQTIWHIPRPTLLALPEARLVEPGAPGVPISPQGGVRRRVTVA